jgi:hypothetical protein
LPSIGGAYSSVAAATEEYLSDYLASYWACEEAAGIGRADSRGDRSCTEQGGNVAQGTGKVGACADPEAADGHYLLSASGFAWGGELAASCWVNIESHAAASVTTFPAGAWDWGIPTADWYIGTSSASTSAAVYQGDGSARVATWNTPLSVGTWYHLCLIADGAYCYLYVDGVLRATSPSYDGTTSAASSSAILGSPNSGAWFFDGLIDEVGVWTNIGAISAATRAAFVASLYNAGAGNTAGAWYPSVTLLHLDGTDESTTITDTATGGSAPHTYTCSGGAQLDTAQKKFGTASLLLDSPDDYVSCTDNLADFCDLGTTWTIEAWVYLNEEDGTAMRVICGAGGTNGWNAADGICWYVALSNDGGNGKLAFSTTPGREPPS